MSKVFYDENIITDIKAPINVYSNKKVGTVLMPGFLLNTFECSSIQFFKNDLKI